MDADLIDGLAVARLTRLVTRDRIADAPRRWLIREAYAWAHAPKVLRERDGDPLDWPTIDGERAPKVAYLVTCPWCSSVWVAVAVVVARRVAPRWWRPVAWALAASEVAGIAVTRSD